MTIARDVYCVTGFPKTGKEIIYGVSYCDLPYLISRFFYLCIFTLKKKSILYSAGVEISRFLSNFASKIYRP